MKNLLRTKSAVFTLGLALAFGVVTARADEEKPTTHHRRHAKVEKAESTAHSRPAASATSRKPLPSIDGRNSQSTEGNAAGVANGTEYRVPTGSRIPRHYNRRGTTTDTFGNSTIIDHNDQRFQEQNTPGDILRTVPGVSVRGR